MSYSLGVDLGTTFIAAAVARSAGAEMVSLANRALVAPSVAYLHNDGALFTGDAANRRAITAPGRAAREFKRRLGDPVPIQLAGVPFTAPSLLGKVLGDVIAQVSEVEGEPDQLVLTYPANWGSYRRGLFQQVPEAAGVSCHTITMTEPAAAAAHYSALKRLEEGQIVAVYDLGGGTFDATIMCGGHDGVEILGTPEGIENLGGVDFDAAILSHVNYVLDGALDEIDRTDPRTVLAMARLHQDCVHAKEALSLDDEAVIPVFLPGESTEVTLTRPSFESMIRAHIESTCDALIRTVRSAGLQPAELGAVLLVGGSSRIPIVAEMVSARLGCPTVVDAHPKHTVALGAAITPLRATGFEPPAQPTTPALSHPPGQHPHPNHQTREADPPMSGTSAPPPWPLPGPTTAHGPTEGASASDRPASHTPAADNASSNPAAFAGAKQRRWRVVIAVAAIGFAFGIGAWLVQGNSASTPQLLLSKSQVRIGESYFATAKGFQPGEEVHLSWSGPTMGMMQMAEADVSGIRREGPIIERDPPGNYEITAVGLSSGQRVSASLTVLPAAAGN